MTGFDIHNAMRREYGFPENSPSDDSEFFKERGGVSWLRRVAVLLAVAMKGML